MNFFHLIKSIAQFLALAFSMFTNFILIILVIYKSPKKIGTYKHLLCYFCVISMVYALLDFIVQPYIHCYGVSFSMIMDLRGSVFQSSLAFLLTASLAACFGVSIYAIAINFIFRFFAIERLDRLRYFDGYRIFFWLLIPISAGIMWLCVGLFFLDYDHQLADYLRVSINETYGLDSNEVTLTGCMYFRPNEFGHFNLCLEDAVGAFMLCTLMFIPFCVICYFGYRSHIKISGISSSNQSAFARRIQTQLHQALMAQTSIPFIFLFFPIGALFTSPLIGINLEKGSILVTFFYTFYPVVDPIPTLYFVDEYRIGFMNFFRQKIHRTQIVPSISYDPNPNLP